MASEIAGARSYPLTACKRIITIEHMRLLMDSDCLIKLVKASLKELVCHHFIVEIPPLVIKETVHESKGLPDAEVIQANLDKKHLAVSGVISPMKRGEDAVYA